MAQGDKALSQNYEIKKSTAIDGRMLKQTLESLFNIATWLASDGIAYIYNGMFVSVVGEVGGYMLIDKNNYQYKFAWVKVAGTSPFDNKILNPLFEGVNASGSGAGWDANEGVFSVVDGVLTMASGGDGTWNVQNTRTVFLPKQGDAVRLAFRLNTTGVATKTTVLAEIRYMTDGGPETISVLQNITSDVQDFVVTGIVAETKPETAVISECEVSFTIAASDGVKLSNVKLHEGEYADLKNNQGSGGGSTDGKDTLDLDLSESDVIDASKYAHVNISNLSVDQRVKLSNVEPGKTYYITLHISESEANMLHKTTPCASHESKSPIHRIVSSLNNQTPGYNQDVQLVVYGVSGADYVINAIHNW